MKKNKMSGKDKQKKKASKLADDFSGKPSSPLKLSNKVHGPLHLTKKGLNGPGSNL